MGDVSDSPAVAAARAYERLHVPALFRQWTGPVLDAAGVGRGDRVLDVACGTGVLAREARQRVGPSGSVTGVDPDPGMLAVAGELAPGIEWRLGRAEALPCPDGGFEAAVSQFGLMFFTDREKAMREMLRVVVRGGRLALAVWADLEHSDGYREEVDLLERVAGPDAADALRAPFVLGDPSELTRLARQGGAASVGVATARGTARFPSVRAMVEADLRGWLPVMGVHLDEERIERILEEAESALAAYVRSDGLVVFDTPALILTGRSR